MDNSPQNSFSGEFSEQQVPSSLINSPEMENIRKSVVRPPAVSSGSVFGQQPTVPVQDVNTQVYVAPKEYVNSGNITIEHVINGDANLYAHLDEEIARIVGEVQEELVNTGRQINDARYNKDLKAAVISDIDRMVNTQLMNLGRTRPIDKPIIIASVINEIMGLGPIEPIWQDSSITEVIVNGPNAIYVERYGKLIRAKGIRFRDKEHLLEICTRIVGPLGRKLDTSSPTVDARLPDGSRVNAVHYEIAPKGPLLTIRRFPEVNRSLVDLVSLGSMTQEMACTLAWLVSNRASLLVIGSTGSGKALALNTPIPTPNGFVQMGDLQLGDVVFNEKGNKVRIIGAYDTQYNRPCYEVKFSDGSSIIADEEHLWSTETRSARVARGKIRNQSYSRKSPLPIEEIANIILVASTMEENKQFRINEVAKMLGWASESNKSRLYKLSSDNRKLGNTSNVLTIPSITRGELLDAADKWSKPWHDQRDKSQEQSIKSTKEIKDTLYAINTLGRSLSNHLNHSIPIISKAVDLDINEDLLIAPRILGLWLGDGASATARFSTADKELLEDFKEAGYTVKHIAKYDYGISGGLQVLLRKEGVLKNKHIPDKYLWASEAQRRALLSGLLDTDGGVSTSGGIEFYSSNYKLASQVLSLVASLGYRPTFRTKNAKLYGRDMGLTYTIAFLGRGDEFGLERKKRSFKERSSPNKQGDRHLQRFIVEINPVESVPVRCIRVDSESHLFLAGETFIPTHNTTLLNSLSAAIPRDERVITIEDSLELRLHPAAHWGAIEARPSDAKHQNSITIKDLVINALRMRPDRIIVGEVRGKEALNMLEACNTGHEGSMSTIHANGANEALARLAVMIAQGGDFPSDKVDWLVGSALDLMIQIKRDKDGMRRITGIYEVPDIYTLKPGEPMRTIPLWEWHRTGEDSNGRFIGEYRKENEISNILKDKLGLDFEPMFTWNDVIELCKY